MLIQVQSRTATDGGADIEFGVLAQEEISCQDCMTLAGPTVEKDERWRCSLTAAIDWTSQAKACYTLQV